MIQPELKHICSVLISILCSGKPIIHRFQNHCYSGIECSSSCNVRKVPEEHGECIDPDHVVGVAVGEEELVCCYNPALTLYTVKPERASLVNGSSVMFIMWYLAVHDNNILTYHSEPLVER